jgi:putative nucleotidyltransferase with HDIG domain
MAYDPLKGELVDLHGGQDDLERRLIRAVGDPAERFDEDGLRPLRAIRFAAQLGFDVEEKTLAAIPGALGKTKCVSAERVREELEKTLLAPAPSRALRLMEDSGILALVLPELARCRGVEQKGGHAFDVLDHCLASLDASPPSLSLRLAALFHDIGKVDTAAVGADGLPTFYNHEARSATMAEALMKRLKFPNAVIDEVCHLIRQHMFYYEENWSDAAVRRFLARVGTEHLENLFALRLADASGKDGTPVGPESLESLRRRVEAIVAAEEALGLKDLVIGGNELAALDIPRGPVMGRILAELLETVLDDPAQNTKEKLSEIARNIKGKYGA